MKFHTETGSIYEVDKTKKRICRISGNNVPTTRQGNDGEWKQFSDITDIKVGIGVLIVWNGDMPLLDGSPKDAVASTMTSDVVKIEP